MVEKEWEQSDSGQGNKHVPVSLLFLSFILFTNVAINQFHFETVETPALLFAAVFQEVQVVVRFVLALAMVRSVCEMKTLYIIFDN